MAVAQTCTTASRRPVTMSGRADGISTGPQQLPAGRIPMPRAASTVSRSTSRMPT